MTEQTSAPSYDTITVERRGRVGIITLDRPQALNALNSRLGAEVVAAATEMDADPGIGAIVVTGSAKAFAAGADIKEMAERGYADVLVEDFFSGWDRFAAVRTPKIAAVSGYALGGGCELAMMCDIILAAESAKFGQPEITLGTIPGLGGTQRLTRLVGRAKAMDLVLTGRMMGAEEAERCGLVSRVVPTEGLLDEAIATAEKVASMSLPVTYVAKEMVAAASETTLSAGIHAERRAFFATFALDDRAEGMAAFVEKRSADFTHR